MTKRASVREGTLDNAGAQCGNFTQAAPDPPKPAELSCCSLCFQKPKGGDQKQNSEQNQAPLKEEGPIAQLIHLRDL